MQLMMESDYSLDRGVGNTQFLVRDFEITWFQLWFRDFNSDFM